MDAVLSNLKHRYHVGRHLAGQSVSVESRRCLLQVSQNGVGRTRS